MSLYPAVHIVNGNYEWKITEEFFTGPYDDVRINALISLYKKFPYYVKGILYSVKCTINYNYIYNQKLKRDNHIKYLIKDSHFKIVENDNFYDHLYIFKHYHYIIKRSPVDIIFCNHIIKYDIMKLIVLYGFCVGKYHNLIRNLPTDFRVIPIRPVLKRYLDKYGRWNHWIFTMRSYPHIYIMNNMNYSSFDKDPMNIIEYFIFCS